MPLALVLAVAWIGTLPGWLTVGAVAFLGYMLTRGQLGPALGYLREANTTLLEENRALHDKVTHLQAENVALRARTDLEPMQAAMLEQAANHEQRAQGRFERTVTILDLIADRLGPDPNGSLQRAEGGV